MTRGNKKAFNIDAQRGEGSAEREAALRGVPIAINETDATIPGPTEPQGTNIPNNNPLQQLANSGGAFAPSGDSRGFTESLTNQDNFQPVEPGQASNVNMILAAINDILGGSEEASSMIG
jgi:hypothetical protein|tara:strand:- start:1087 stop:1446 length:360 start_codon:yes stop_codon:yes gene_type:complete